MSVDRKSRNEANIRMMALLQDPPGWRCKDRLQDEAQDNAGTRKGHLQDGERELLMMNGGSGRSGQT